MSSLRVTAYINNHLVPLCFSLQTDIINHTDILFLYFTSNCFQYFILNIYSDSAHIVLKYLKNIEVNINNILVITGNFNIRDSLWDSSFPHHSSISDDLLLIANSFQLALSMPTNPFPTRYSDTVGEANLTIDLMFLRYDSIELNQHSIHPDWWLTSDHAPLSITIPITNKFITTLKLSIQQNSEQENAFIKEVISVFQNLDTLNISNKECLENMVNILNSLINQAWNKNTKQLRITRHSKQWWNNKCNRAINKYRVSRSLESWKKFRRVVKDTKRTFFDTKIWEVASKSRSPWELMNWVNKRKLPTTEAIKYNGNSCITTDSLWEAFHATFNSALHRPIDEEVLNEIKPKPTTIWAPFSKEEFCQALTKCNNLLAPGPDKLTWQHLKTILKQETCLAQIINIANACIHLEYWPSHFKQSSTIIIPKPNKQTYNNPKSFCPIILLNTLEKLIEKVIADRLQFYVVKNNFIHPSQLGGLKFKSTSDTGVALTHAICSGWVKNKTTSTLAFNIA